MVMERNIGNNGDYDDSYFRYHERFSCGTIPIEGDDDDDSDDDDSGYDYAPAA